MEVLGFGKAVFNECVTGLTSVFSVALHNGEDEGQLIMYSVPFLWPCCIIVKHKRSLCACLPPEPSHIPELLLDTAVPLAEEAPDRPTAPRLPDLPENPVDFQSQVGESFFGTRFQLTPNDKDDHLYCTPSVCLSLTMN